MCFFWKNDVDVERIKRIHQYLTDYFASDEDPISPPGIKSIELLESSAARPYITVDGDDAYAGVFNKASALFHSIINNHCFYNGNKRTALLSALIYLGENAWWVTGATDEELFEFTRKAAAHELTQDKKEEIYFISEWFKSHSRRRNVGEFNLKFAQLKEILLKFDYELGDCVGRTIDVIKNGVVVTKILQKGSKGQEDYDKQYIKRLRKKLKLSSEYGVDRYVFYGDRGLEEPLSALMKLRHKVIRDLAKT